MGIMNKILLPVDFPNSQLKVVRQAAFLARHFHSQIILLHVVTPIAIQLAYWSLGMNSPGTCMRKSSSGPRRSWINRCGRSSTELRSDACCSMVIRPGKSLQIARDEKVNLIVMSTHGHGVIYRFLLGSVAAKVLHDSDCPVWTDTQLEEASGREFTIRSVLCAVDLRPHSRNTVLRAAQMAAEFEARLTLVHITGSLEIYGPGGSHVDPVWKETIVGFATKEIAKLQEDLGTKAEVIIDSGNV